MKNNVKKIEQKKNNNISNIPQNVKQDKKPNNASPIKVSEKEPKKEIKKEKPKEQKPIEEKPKEDKPKEEKPKEEKPKEEKPIEQKKEEESPIKESARSNDIEIKDDFITEEEKERLTKKRNKEILEDPNAIPDDIDEEEPKDPDSYDASTVEDEI